MRAAEDERRRFALALHDGAGQALSAALLQVEALGAAVPDGSERVAPLRRMLAGTLDELRRIAHALRPATLDSVGLTAALRELVASVATPGLEASLVTGEGDGGLRGEAALHLFRIAQAALANVMQHARATRVEVALARESDALALVIRDDGVGFESRAPGPGAGLGLAGIRERAAALGGSCHIESAPGEGTRISVNVPWEDA